MPDADLKFETVAVASLKQHPMNYRDHPPEQLEHLVQSIREHGLYRNVVVARDGTILAGHGIVLAATELGITEIPVARLDVAPDSVQAMKVLVGDNEIEHMGVADERQLTAILRDILTVDDAGLLGTGFDKQMLAGLVLITRPEDEIPDLDAAAEWVGMPEITPSGLVEYASVHVMFLGPEQMADFAKKLGIVLDRKKSSVWWPPEHKRKPRHNLVTFEQGGDKETDE